MLRFKDTPLLFAVKKLYFREKVEFSDSENFENQLAIFFHVTMVTRNLENTGNRDFDNYISAKLAYVVLDLLSNW